MISSIRLNWNIERNRVAGIPNEGALWPDNDPGRHHQIPHRAGSVQDHDHQHQEQHGRRDERQENRSHGAQHNQRRQADQQVAEKLLGAVPKDIDLEKIYGIKKVPELPVVDMVVRSTTMNTRK